VSSTELLDTSSVCITGLVHLGSVVTVSGDNALAFSSCLSHPRLLLHCPHAL